MDPGLAVPEKVKFTVAESGLVTPVTNKPVVPVSIVNIDNATEVSKLLPVTTIVGFNSPWVIGDDVEITGAEAE